METIIQAIRIGTGTSWIELSPEGDRLRATFQSKSLSGSWATDPVDFATAGKELHALHTDLSGTVLLSDNGSLAIIFSVNATGNVSADIHIEGWPFGVEGSFKFSLPVDHIELLQLAKGLARATP